MCLKSCRKPAVKTKVTFLLRWICQGKRSHSDCCSLKLPLWFSGIVEAGASDSAIYWLLSVSTVSSLTTLPWAVGYFSCCRWCDSTPPSPSTWFINKRKSGFISGYRGRLETNSGYLLLRSETLWFSVSIFTVISIWTFSCMRYV